MVNNISDATYRSSQTMRLRTHIKSIQVVLCDGKQPVTHTRLLLHYQKHIRSNHIHTRLWAQRRSVPQHQSHTMPKHTLHLNIRPQRRSSHKHREHIQCRRQQHTTTPSRKNKRDWNACDGKAWRIFRGSSAWIQTERPLAALFLTPSTNTRLIHVVSARCTLSSSPQSAHLVQGRLKKNAQEAFFGGIGDFF